MVWALIITMGLIQPGDFEKVRTAIEIYESNRNEAAFKEDENAAGCLQIRPIMVDEVNRICGLTGDKRRFTLKDRFFRTKSYEMFEIFTLYWCDRRDDYSVQGIARRWNGGDRGHKKKSTERYWREVKPIYESL